MGIYSKRPKTKTSPLICQNIQFYMSQNAPSTFSVYLIKLKIANIFFVNTLVKMSQSQNVPSQNVPKSKRPNSTCPKVKTSQGNTSQSQNVPSQNVPSQNIPKSKCPKVKTSQSQNVTELKRSKSKHLKVKPSQSQNIPSQDVPSQTIPFCFVCHS